MADRFKANPVLLAGRLRLGCSRTAGWALVHLPIVFCVLPPLVARASVLTC